MRKPEILREHQRVPVLLVVAAGHRRRRQCGRHRARQPTPPPPSLRRRLATGAHHAGIGIATGAALVLLIGWTSGFLPDIAAPMSGAANTSFPALTTALWSAMGAIAFGILSFAHAGVLHASLSFTAADVRDQPLPK